MSERRDSIPSRGRATGNANVNVCGAAHPTAGARHPGRTINFLSVSPISAAIRVVIFSPIRRGRDGEFCGGTGNTHDAHCNNHTVMCCAYK